MITPATYPNFFYPVEVGPFSYDVCKEITVGLFEDIEEAKRDAYAFAKPQECTGGVIEEKYFEWAASREGKAAINRAQAALLFIPKGNTPPITDDDPWHLLPGDVLLRAFGFLDPPSSDSTTEPQESTKSGEVSPDSESTSNP